MKHIILTTLVAFAARCAAQGPLTTLDNLPNCAKPCANTLPTQCNLGVQCICADQAFITGISCCIATACSQPDQQKTLQVAQQLCDTVNVKLPSAAACSGSSSLASSTNAATSATSATSAISATSAATGTASSAVSQASTGATSATSSGGATAGSATGSTTSATPSSTTASTGAGERFGSHIGAIGAAVAALALL